MRGPRDPATRLAVVLGAWVLTRVLLLVLSRARELYPYQDDPFEVSVLAGWGAAFAGQSDGEVPLRDGPWEYPAGAAVVLVLPALLRGAPYVLGLVGEMLLVDAALVLLLALRGVRPHGSLAGAWLWVLAVPLLGPVALARFDVVPTALAAGAMVAAAGAAPLLAGVLLGAGAVVKLWPALLLPLVLLLHGGRGRVLAGAVAVGAGTLVAVAAHGGLPQLLSFLAYQRDRGLEVESVPALALMAQRAAGDERVSVGFGFGSYQVDGPSAETWLLVGDLGILAVLLLTAVLALRVRRTAAPATAVAVLATVLLTGVLVVDKVLSAQYPLWLAGVVAVGLTVPRSPLRVLVAPLLGVLVLTHAVYPLAIQDLLAGAVQPVVLLAARDLLLVVVLVLGVRAAWQLPSEDEVPVDEEHRQQTEPGR